MTDQTTWDLVALLDRLIAEFDRLTEIADSRGHQGAPQVLVDVAYLMTLRDKVQAYVTLVTDDASPWPAYLVAERSLLTFIRTGQTATMTPRRAGDSLVTTTPTDTKEEDE